MSQQATDVDYHLLPLISRSQLQRQYIVPLRTTTTSNYKSGGGATVGGSVLELVEQ